MTLTPGTLLGIAVLLAICYMIACILRVALLGGGKKADVYRPAVRTAKHRAEIIARIDRAYERELKRKGNAK